MIGQYLIAFREVLEAALILSIILAYFLRTGNKHLGRFVWIGALIALAASASIAIIVSIIYGGLSSSAAKLFEGIAALIAVLVLSSMIIWMALKGKHIKDEITEKLGTTVKKGAIMGLIGFSFVVVFREGFETVLFLIPFGASDAAGTLAGALLGILSALVLSYFIFSIGVRINLNRFFFFTSILLVLLAAGLLGYGVHEIISYQNAVGADSGWLGTYAFDLGIPDDSVLHHKGAVGSVFAVMVGYSIKMEWGRVIAHSAYLMFFVPLTILVYRRPGSLESVRRFVDKIRVINQTIMKSHDKIECSEETKT